MTEADLEDLLVGAHTEPADGRIPDHSRRGRHGLSTIVERVPKELKTRRRHSMADDNMHPLRSSVTRHYPAVVLTDASGVRRGELLALEWTDLDWVLNYLHTKSQRDLLSNWGEYCRTSSGLSGSGDLP
jgi:hypothetical protein